jgi:hypothetical protein
MVWKTILPVGSRNNRFGKWSPSWEGPLKIVRVVPGNSYFVETLDGRELPKALNGKYLKGTIQVCGKERDEELIQKRGPDGW